MMRWALLIGVAASSALAGQSLFTVRLGEQDTCTITGVTTVQSQKDGATIRFDVSKIKAPKKAILRLWVDLEGNAPFARAFGIGRWSDPAFDGFKVWQEGGDEKPLATSFPFAFASPVCHEWDVTAAVQAWVADPAANKGLRTSFPLPADGFEPAWQRPYLEITCSGPNPNRPPQPTELRAFYRSGQVFLTWKQAPYDGAFFDRTYRTYLHTEPITARNLDRATVAGEAHGNSQLNYRRTVYSHDAMGSYAAYIHFKSFLLPGGERPKDMTEKAYWEALAAKVPLRYNFVIDDTWAAKVEDGKWLSDAKVLGEGLRELKGPELSDDTGLFVHTVAEPGKVYFAVTSVVEGNENREDFAAGNALAEPLDVKVETPKPVLQVAFHESIKHRRERQIREYVYWGGGTDGQHTEPSTPFYFRLVPPPELIGLRKPGATPPWIVAEPFWSHALAEINTDGIYIPPTRLAPFPPRAVPFSRGGWKEGARFYYGSRKGPDESARWGPHIQRSGNLYGYHDAMNTGRDPRKATVLPFFENRLLREIEHFFREFPQASRDHVVMTGESSAILMAIHHPDVFAFCSAAQDVPWTAPRQAHQWRMVGKREWGLKNDLGFPVWNYCDPVWLAKKFPDRAWPFIGLCQSDNYDRSDDSNWGQAGYPGLFLALAAEKRAGKWWWCDIGDAPNGGWPAVARNQAHPAFTNVNFAEVPQKEWKNEPRGSLNGYLDWHRPETPFKLKSKEPPALPLDLVDTPQRFEMAIRIGELGRTLNGQSVPPTTARFGQTDITPWRLQQFKTEKGRKYLWTNRKVATGQLLQAGVVTADERGLVTVPGFFVDQDPPGNKLILEPADGKDVPKVDAAAKVGELTYEQYAQQCRNPQLFPVVKPPMTKLTIAEFTSVRGGNPDGSLTFKGGSFGNVYETLLTVEKPGPYIITARAKAEFGAAWPLLILSVGGKYGEKLETKVIDTPDWAPYSWYATLPAGKLAIRLTVPNEYYMASALPDLKNQRLHIADLTFTAATNAPAEIRSAPRQVAIPAGMPIVLKASVLNGLGKPVPTPVKWSCSEGKVDAEGRFVCDKPGECLITAEAGGVKATAPIQVADRFTDDFNCGTAVLRFWSSFDLGAEKGEWHPPAAGHHFLNSLWQHSRAAKSALLWDHATLWTDYSVQADVFLAPRDRGQPLEIGKGKKAVHGLVVRATDGNNHYRLEVERRDDGSEARLVKRVNGTETVLAKTDSPPPLAPFDWKTNPMCPGWRDTPQAIAEERGLHHWRVDTMRLEAKGDTLRAWLNGKEVFPAAVKDPDLKAGTFGLCAEGQTVMDNVEARPAK
ncbi:MAG TPA: hypothetical protein VNE39_16945 [Planctomycetota bacterium]|nr:hypothetical protein [Planctomycetota bacterium]